VSRSEELLLAALKSLPEKPGDDAAQPVKKRYSELMSQVFALAIAEELRQRGLKESRPGGDGELGGRGAERRMSGGIGAKKVDVTWATEESGLILALSLKCITSKDSSTGNYQKNLINRRGEMLGEAVTLHRRFPYAVLGAFLFFDKGAAEDGSDKRSTTFRNAHRAFRIFSGRGDPAGRDEQYERLYIALVDPSPFQPSVRFTHAGDPDTSISLDEALDPLLKLVVERDPDFWALLGPNDEIDPALGASPLSLARMKPGGTIVKSPRPKKPKKSKSTELPTISLDEPLPLGEEDQEQEE
jgi:hypothetical protein